MSVENVEDLRIKYANLLDKSAEYFLRVEGELLLGAVKAERETSTKPNPEPVMVLYSEDRGVNIGEKFVGLAKKQPVVSSVSRVKSELTGDFFEDRLAVGMNLNVINFSRILEDEDVELIRYPR